MRNLLLKIGYSGLHYHGWQIQQNALTVQEVFQNALYKVIGEEPDIKACSRTDTGVHAREFCISFKTNSKIPSERLTAALNHYLPEDIAAFSCEEVPEEFHARYSCVGKEYKYEIWDSQIRNPFLSGHALHYWYKLDEKELSKAAAYYIGKHDFTSFCTQDKREIGDFRRTVTKAEVMRDGEKVVFTVAADGFLYNMVRIMTGTLLRVQQGKIQTEDIPKIIAAKDRKAAGPTAPPCGLYLNKVIY
jgi:pseudouridylate synthase I